MSSIKRERPFGVSLSYTSLSKRTRATLRSRIVRKAKVQTSQMHLVTEWIDCIPTVSPFLVAEESYPGEPYLFLYRLHVLQPEFGNCIKEVVDPERCWMLAWPGSGDLDRYVLQNAVQEDPHAILYKLVIKANSFRTSMLNNYVTGDTYWKTLEGAGKSQPIFSELCANRLYSDLCFASGKDLVPLHLTSNGMSLVEESLGIEILVDDFCKRYGVETCRYYTGILFFKDPVNEEIFAITFSNRVVLPHIKALFGKIEGEDSEVQEAPGEIPWPLQKACASS